MNRIASATTSTTEDPNEVSAGRALGIAPAGVCLGWLSILLAAHAFQTAITARALELWTSPYDTYFVVPSPVLILFWLAFPLFSIIYFLLRDRHVSLGQLTLVWLHVWLSALSQALWAVALLSIAGMPSFIDKESELLYWWNAFASVPAYTFVAAQIFVLWFWIGTRRRV